MFKIESKIKHGGLWDGKNNRLLTFENGALETNDTDLAEKCREIKGFTVSGAADVPDKFKGWSVEQLKAYADENKIDIGNATSVNGILKKITDAEAKNG